MSADSRAAVLQESILIVEDNPAIAAGLSEYLSEHYTVLHAANGREAIKVVEHAHPRLVFLDLGLPDIDGLEVLRAIRALDPGISIIVVSGNPDPHLLGGLLKRGAFAVIPKPVSLEYLDHLIDAARDR